MLSVDNSEEDKLNEEIVESEEFDCAIYGEARERVFINVYSYPKYDGHYDSIYENMLDSLNTLEMHDIVIEEKSYSYHYKRCGKTSSDRENHENHMTSIYLDGDRIR